MDQEPLRPLEIVGVRARHLGYLDGRGTCNRGVLRGLCYHGGQGRSGVLGGRLSGPLSGTSAVRAAAVAAGLLIAQQVAGKATRDALFLSSFDVRTLPPVAAASALLSLLGVLAFSRGMAALSPARMVPLVLGLGAALLLGEWVLSFAFPRVAAVAVYLHQGLFGATLVSGFWSLVNERFDPHTARRAMGRIGTGATLGGMLGGLVTWRAAAFVSVPTMLVVLACLNVLCLRALLPLAPAAGSVAPGTEPRARGAEDPHGPSSGLRVIREAPYLRRLALVVGLSAVMDALLDYVFNAAAASSFARGRALMSFFALFHTAVGLQAVAVQATLARPFLERLGLARTIAMQPALAAVGGLLVLSLPRLWTIALLRGAQAVLRNSLFRSGYELLYTPLLKEQKRPAKAIVDVAFDRFGAIAGNAVVMLVLLAAPMMPTQLLLLLAAACGAVTLALCPRLQRGYVGALAESLRSGGVRLEASDVVDATTRHTLASLAGEAALRLGRPPARELGPRATAAALVAPDPLLHAIAELRSRDPERVQRVLEREGPLGPILVAHLIPLLAEDRVFRPVVGALRRLAPRCTGQLLDALLDPEEDPVVRRRIPRVLKAAPTQRGADGLLLGLREPRFDIRYRCAQALAKMKDQNPGLVIPREQVLSEALREVEAGSRHTRHLDHVFTVLSLALEGEPLEIALRALRLGDEVLRGTALEYLHNVLPGPLREKLWPDLGGQERPLASGRSIEAIRDDLLRSTASLSFRRSAGRRPPRTAD